MICPDLDTVCYNLAGIANKSSGWGRADESWTVLGEIAVLNGPDWFQLGDKDLATHLERTRRFHAGERLSTITEDFCRHWSINVQVLPMSDDPVPTIVITDQGELSFQDYFVKHGAQPQVRGFRFENVKSAQPAPGVLEAVRESDLVIICPSNPWVSIDPILAVPGIREEVNKKHVLAVSPIIGGETVKGPAAKMFRELGRPPSAAAVAEHYRDLITAIVYDSRDQALADLENAQGNRNYRIFTTDTLMRDHEERVRVAERVLNIGKGILKEVN
jgi:LPPG:FO 2-phospho-L-lactate transferase